MLLPMLATLAAAAAAAPAAPAAPAQDLSTHDPASIVGFLRDTGYKAELTKDSAGDPMIRSAAGGTNFNIYFYNCKDHRECADIAFHAGYNFDAGKEPKPDLINRYNRDFRFANATLDDEQDPHLQMDLLFTDGRLGRKAFEEAFEVWIDCMADFEKRVGW